MFGDVLELNPEDNLGEIYKGVTKVIPRKFPAGIRKDVFGGIPKRIMGKISKGTIGGITKLR